MMRLVLILVLWCSSTAIASPENLEAADDFISVEEMRSAIYDRRYRDVENAFMAAQSDFLARRIEADDIRSLFMLFETTHPEILSFSKTWVDRMPDSAFAHTARAWSLINGGWITRGEGVAGDIHPHALSEFRKMHSQAWQHAREAYRLNPRLVGASDAIFVLGNSMGAKQAGRKALKKVMETDPNMGSLRRALFLTHAGWGGRRSQAEQMCDTYAPKVQFDMDPVLYCKLYAALNYHNLTDGDWAHQMVWNIPVPTLIEDTTFAYYMVNATESQAATLAEYFKRPDVLNMGGAMAFDMYLAGRYDHDFLSEAVMRRAKADAREKLKHDPFDPKLLSLLLMPVTQFAIDPQGRTYEAGEDRITLAEETDFTRRRLIVQPYIASHWLSYARARFDVMEADGIGLNNPYWENAIYYSQHDIQHVVRYLWDKNYEYEVILKAQRGEGPEKWRNAGEGVDLGPQILCPMVRTYRLADHLCAQPGADLSENSYCDVNDQQRVKYDIALADAKSRGLCRLEFAAPAEQLFFTPVAIDLNEAEF
ncbi:DUF4034 domain-containing protein [Roseovarius faecimaris]|uniref:DUF4034 domain-containing protein n=1 Tax=Roseovarius faecimaris TaxID=2494550 RepID=A0A6I6ISX9_9RHOB|nr:DUF4034 domain-containing protein [Roseovarius faecimaris]QGX99825.1 DUF4034 domain-containing protein [Roseovarius faecimaris]